MLLKENACKKRNAHKMFLTVKIMKMYMIGSY
jgi:hypothetical protein